MAEAPVPAGNPPTHSLNFSLGFFTGVEAVFGPQGPKTLKYKTGWEGAYR